jgi:cytochrome c peroxidase
MPPFDHQGAIADAKSAVAWYQKRSPKTALDFIEEMHRAAETIREAPERWP